MTRNPFQARRTAILSIASTLLASSIATAQTPPVSPAAAPQSGLVWSADFAQRVAGRHLIITTTDGRRFEGTVWVSPTGLETSGKAGVSVAFGQVSRIEKPTYRMRKGAWLGALAGAGLGIGLACANGRQCADDDDLGWFAGALVFGGIGAGAGAAIGAVLNHTHRNDDVLYDSYRRTTTVAVAPILSPTRKGVALRVTWR